MQLELAYSLVKRRAYDFVTVRTFVSAYNLEPTDIWLYSTVGRL